MTVVLNILFGILLCYLLYTEIKKVISPVNTNVQNTIFLLLTLEHFFAAIFFYFLLDKLPNNDVYKTIETVQNSNNWMECFSLGGKIIAFVCYPFLKSGIHIALLFFMFALISFKGIINYMKLIGIDRLSKVGIPIVVLFFMPSFHFWTGYVGKDALTFTLLSYLLIVIKNRNFNWKLALIFSLLFIMRPHVAIVILIALWITFLVDKNMSKKHKLGITFIGLFIGSIIIPIALLYFLQIETFSFDAINNYISDFVAFSQKEANTSISLVDTSFLKRLLYLLIMPLPFVYDLNSSFLVLVSIENVFYLIVIVYLGCSLFKKGLVFSLKKIEVRFAFISSIFLAMLFALYMYNLGLGNRMRVLFFPYIFYVVVMSLQFKLLKNE